MVETFEALGADLSGLSDDAIVSERLVALENGVREIIGPGTVGFYQSIAMVAQLRDIVFYRRAVWS